MACILAYLFNSNFLQCCEIWASQFPFLHSLKEVIAPSEACLYGHINWSLAQAHSVGLSQSYPLKRGGKARPWTGFHFTVQKRPLSRSVPGTSGASLPKRPHMESGNEAHPSGRSLLVAVSPPVLLSLVERGAWGSALLNVPGSSASSASSSYTPAAFQFGMLFKFLINGEALHPKGLYLIWFGVTIFSLGPIFLCSMRSVF